MPDSADITPDQLPDNADITPDQLPPNDGSTPAKARPKLKSKVKPKVKSKQQPAEKPNIKSPPPLPSQGNWTDKDHESLGVLLASWTSEFGKMTTRQIEKMIELWNKYPDEEIHQYAWRQMAQAREKRRVRPNLAYYEKCLETEAQANWTLDEGGNGREPET